MDNDMFKKCIINTCNTTKAGDGVTLHGLPESAQIQQEWFRAILNETGQTVFSEDDVICSKHFSEDSLIVINGKKELVPTAIPFANLEQPPAKKLKCEKTFAQCSVFSCGNILATTQETRPDLNYHAFPKNIQLAKKWKSFCNKLDDDFENSFVCSDHFTSGDYTSGPKATKGLKANACPSIYKKENSHDDEQDSTTIDTSITQSSVDMNVDYSIDDSAKNIKKNVDDWGELDYMNAFTLNITTGQQIVSNEDKKSQENADLIKRARNTERKRRWRHSQQAMESPEEANLRRGRQAEFMRQWRKSRQANETPEQAAARRAMQTEQVRKSRTAQSTDEKMCIIETCQSHSTPTPDLEYYPIPNQINTRKTWIRLLLAHTKQTDIPQNVFICSLHFAKDCFRVNPLNQNKILLANAVPSIFPTPKLEDDDFPAISPTDLTDPECGKEFYNWCLKTYNEQKKQIQALRQKNIIQSKRIARLAKSVDDFKAKRYVSDEANSALQNLFDKIIDAQYEVV